MLGPHQVRAFYEIGYVIVPDVFGSHEVAEMRAAFDRLRAMAETLDGPGLYRGSQFVIEPGAGPRSVRIHRIVWCGAAEPVLSAYGSDPRLVGMAVQLLESAVVQQLINQAHFKLPGDGVHFPWHQDSVHRRHGSSQWRDVNGKGSYVQTVTALDEMSEENGPLELIPGSCRLGHVTLAPETELVVEAADERRAVAATLHPGDVLLFGPYTIHRSLPNRSAEPRRVFINGFAYPGANSRVYPGEGAGRLVP